jgi:hypothetical protein
MKIPAASSGVLKIIIITKIKAVEEARNRPSRKKRAMINTT